MGHYTIEELEGRNIILAFNLKPAKLRGIKSNGMLLAAENKEHMEVLFPANGVPGDRVLLEGDSESLEAPGKKIKIDRFFEIPITVKDSVAGVGETALCIKGQPVKAEKVVNGEVG